METQKSDTDNKLDDYEVIEQLGRITVGTTFLVLHRIEKKKYVLKKIALAKQTEKSKRTAHQEVSGTPNDLCPELLAGIPYGYKFDIWSLGYCMFDIAAHQPPFKASDKIGLINKINQGLFSPLSIIYSSTLKQIIKSMLRKTLEHQPTVANLLRHQHLQPYLLLCHNPSSAFLPVKSPSRAKAKTRPSPGKSINPRGSIDRQLKLKEKRTVLYFDESDNIQPRNLFDKYNTFRAKLDPKRVDRTSYSVRISQDSEDSKSGEMSEAVVCNGYDQQETISQIETTITLSSSSSRAKTWSEEQEHVSPEHVSRFDEGDTKNNKTKELEVLSSPLYHEETDIVECISIKSSRMPLSDGRFNDKTRSFDEKSTSPNSQLAKPDPEVAPRCFIAETENGSECREVAIDCLSSESDGSLLHKDDLEKKATTVYDTKQTKKDVLRSLEYKVSQLKSLAALASKEDKDDWGNPTEQRAESLESLLEVCGRLLKKEKIDELAGVLKPFGDDGMASRETTIWLTKSLLTAQKLSKGS